MEISDTEEGNVARGDNFPIPDSMEYVASAKTSNYIQFIQIIEDEKLGPQAPGKRKAKFSLLTDLQILIQKSSVDHAVGQIKIQRKDAGGIKKCIRPDNKAMEIIVRWVHQQFSGRKPRTPSIAVISE